MTDFKIGSFTMSQATDLTNCDLEPIHIPGFIQPHGLLFVLKEPELLIIQLSNNTLNLINRSPEELLNQPLHLLFDPEQIDYLRKALLTETFEANPLYLFTIRPKNQSHVFNGIIHRYEGVLILELEQIITEEATANVLAPHNAYNEVRLALSKIHRKINLTEFSQVITEQVKSITGFERVMVYRFNEEDGSGTVIAESKQNNLSSFMGLHYPASDIPKQARALYLLNWVRLIANVNYQPAQVVPVINPQTLRSLDMSYSVLRSVSPVHIEYLKNMGLGASMSISIIDEDKLWGLIICHHPTARYVSYDIRTACEFLGQVISLQLSSKQDYENSEYELKLKTTLARLVELMAQEKRFVEGLLNHEPNLLDFIDTGGVAVCFEGEYYLAGQTPSPAQIRALARWLDDQSVSAEGFQTNSLPSLYSSSLEFKDTASGILAIPILQGQRNYLIWFRPEEIQTVTWGGNPDKAVSANEAGLRLSPRKSFEAWKKTVELKSLPWKRCEVEAARELRNVIVNIVLHHAMELAELNIELERSNNELDAFAYIASHDLKEPLRGIHNYSNLLLEGYADRLDEGGQAKLNTMVRLTQRMDKLIESLLYYSQVGQLDLELKEIDLNDTLKQVIEMLQARLEEDGGKVRMVVPPSLPSVIGDPVRVGEIFQNLLSNAIKYNRSPEKIIEVGYLESDPEPAPLSPTRLEENVEAVSKNPTVFYVRDNGIGIREKNFEVIFQIFKRLHGRDDFGGGTGAGLTIVKRLVERHGGYIRLESVIGEGTTFYFTLQG